MKVTAVSGILTNAVRRLKEVGKVGSGDFRPFSDYLSGRDSPKDVAFECTLVLDLLAQTDGDPSDQDSRFGKIAVAAGEAPGLPFLGLEGQADFHLTDDGGESNVILTTNEGHAWCGKWRSVDGGSVRAVFVYPESRADSFKGTVLHVDLDQPERSRVEFFDAAGKDWNLADGR